MLPQEHVHISTMIEEKDILLQILFDWENEGIS